MTREEWDADWLACFNRLRAKGYDLDKARDTARAITTARIGPRPPGTPLWLKIGIRIAAGKLLRKAQGLAQEKAMGARILNAVIYGVLAVLGALQATGIPHDEAGYLGLISVFAVAAWGKFSTNTRLIAMDRNEWTPEKRAAEQAVTDADAAPKP